MTTNTNTVAKNTMTKSAALEYVLTNCQLPADVAEKLTAMRTQLANRAAAPSKPTATQVENATLKAAMMETLAAQDRPLTVAELWENTPALANYSANGKRMTSQRVTALVSQLVKEKLVERGERKGKAYFSLAEVAKENEG